MDRSERHLRVESSLSSALSRRWDCRYQSDGLSQETPGTPFYGSSQSSHEKGIRSRVSSDHYAYHQHSLSDEALYYLESPSNNLHAPRGMTPVQRYDLGELSTPTRGARLNSSAFPQSSERQYATETISHDHFSPPLSESSRWASSSKHSTFLSSRNISGRRPFISTPIYPLALSNPVSEVESGAIAGPSSSKRKIHSDHLGHSSSWPQNTVIPELKFHQPLPDFQNVGISPDNGASSRREGFRWSNVSSYDLGFNGDAIDLSERNNFEKPRSPSCSAWYQKCGLCYRLLSQKSPWSSHRFVRSRDLPITGVLPCGHVFHADCLEETTSKSQIQEPPCPQCLNLVDHRGCTSFSEPLQADRKTVHTTRAVDATSNPSGSSSNQHKSQLLRGSSSMRSRLMKRLSFKGKTG